MGLHLNWRFPKGRFHSSIHHFQKYIGLPKEKRKKRSWAIMWWFNTSANILYITSWSYDKTCKNPTVASKEKSWKEVASFICSITYRWCFDNLKTLEWGRVADRKASTMLILSLRRPCHQRGQRHNTTTPIQWFSNLFAPRYTFLNDTLLVPTNIFKKVMHK